MCFQVQGPWMKAKQKEEIEAEQEGVCSWIWNCYKERPSGGRGNGMLRKYDLNSNPNVLQQMER